MTDELIIGIDPDIDASGYAVLSRQTRSIQQAGTMTFASLVRFIEELAQGHAEAVLVIEDSDRATNWHYNPRDSRAVIAAKGRSAGLCHAVGRLLSEIAEANGLEVIRQRPLLKTWKGKDRKITHAEAAQFIRGLPSRTNQETRDAALLAWHAAGLPVRLRV